MSAYKSSSSVSKPRVRQNHHKQGLNQTIEKLSADSEALYEFADYPASIINVPLKFSDGSTLNLKEAQQRFSRPIFGGLERLGVIAKGTIEEAKAEVDKVLENASPNFILGADCTVPGDTDWEKLRAVIDYAHTWRQTHKK